MKFVKVTPVWVEHRWNEEDMAEINDEFEPIYINPFQITVMSGHTITDPKNQDPPVELTKINILGQDQSILIKMPIKQFRMLAEGARQEAIQILYGEKNE